MGAIWAALTGLFCYDLRMIPTPDLPDDVATLKALFIARDDRIDRLEKLVAEFKRALFGKRAERAGP